MSYDSFFKNKTKEKVICSKKQKQKKKKLLNIYLRKMVYIFLAQCSYFLLFALYFPIFILFFSLLLEVISPSPRRSFLFTHPTNHPT